MRVLSVSEVRRHLYWTNGGAAASGTGAPSTALLGQIFHELYGALTGTDVQKNLAAPLELADASLGAWQRALIDHAFGAVVAPALSRHEHALQTHGAAVLEFWAAARELCGWLAALMHDQRAADATRSLEAVRRLVFADAEVDLDVTLTDPLWPEPVRLLGRADALLSRRTDTERCLVELKLGRTYPEADLLQGCLYHLMLAERMPALADAALGMISFEPQRREQLFDAARLRAAQAALKRLIGELAGFVPGSRGTAVKPAPGGSPIPDVPDAALRDLRERLTAAFAEYGAALTFADDVLNGPAFIRFHATPQRGVSVTSLSRLVANVWMRIGTAQAPQVSLQHGRIAIDVERPDRQVVAFAAWRALLPARSEAGSARFAIGVRVDGTLAGADLSASQSPHLLVAGTTGSGKSEWLRAFLASMLAVNSPATLRLALIDPKRLAFAALEHSPYLWEPIVHDDGAIALLDRLIVEMERRFGLLQSAGVDDLAGYHELSAAGSLPACPRLVCVCDEYADLILRDRAQRTAVEERVARIGVKGRAAGVHLVFATQRAGREVLKGTIDANLPARVALSVARKTDSRLVLGEAGAEALLGRGDLLYKDIGEPVRMQGLYVTREELTALGRA